MAETKNEAKPESKRAKLELRLVLTDVHGKEHKAELEAITLKPGVHEGSLPLFMRVLSAKLREQFHSLFE